MFERGGSIGENGVGFFLGGGFSRGYEEGRKEGTTDGTNR